MQHVTQRKEVTLPAILPTTRSRVTGYEREDYSFTNHNMESKAVNYTSN